MKAFSLLLVLTIFFNSFVRQNNRLQLLEGISYQSNQSTRIYVYTFENISYRQTVEVKYQSDIEISFKITTEDKKEKKSSTIQGLAKRKITETLEQDENDKGELYDTYQYIYSKGECLLLIRIGKCQKNLLKLTKYRCSNLIGVKDGLFTLNIMLRSKDFN